MTTLCIHGASDDLVEFSGAISEEFYLNKHDGWGGTLVAPSGEALRVEAKYGPDEWEVRVANSPDRPIPDWPIHFGQRPDREDDPAVFIDVPDGVYIIDDEADSDDE